MQIILNSPIIMLLSEDSCVIWSTYFCFLVVGQDYLCFSYFKGMLAEGAGNILLTWFVKRTDAISLICAKNISFFYSGLRYFILSVLTRGHLKAQGSYIPPHTSWDPIPLSSSIQKIFPSLFIHGLLKSRWERNQLHQTQLGICIITVWGSQSSWHQCKDNRVSKLRWRLVEHTWYCSSVERDHCGQKGGGGRKRERRN